MKSFEPDPHIVGLMRGLMFSIFAIALGLFPILSNLSSDREIETIRRNGVPFDAPIVGTTTNIDPEGPSITVEMPTASGDTTRTLDLSLDEAWRRHFVGLGVYPIIYLPEDPTEWIRADQPTVPKQTYVIFGVLACIGVIVGTVSVRRHGREGIKAMRRFSGSTE